MLTANTGAGCPGLIADPFARFHGFPKRTGEYHEPPSTKLVAVATRTAQPFTSISHLR